MTSLDAMKALGGTNSKQISDEVTKQVNGHRDAIGKLKNTAGVDPDAVGRFEQATDRLDLLKTLSTQSGSSMGNTISGPELSILKDAARDAQKASTQDFKTSVEDKSTLSGADKAEGVDEPTATKTATKTADDAAEASTKADTDPYATSGGKTYRAGATATELEAGDKSLTEGDKGEGVKELQSRLKAAGYDLGDKGVDGYYGPATQKAVEKERADRGLEADSKKGAGVDSSDFERIGGLAKSGSSAAVKEGAGTRAERLGASDIPGVANRVKDAFASGGSGRVNELLGQMNGAELKAVRDQIGTKKLEEMIGDIRKTGTTGYDSDYGEALQASAFGDRKALKDGEVAGFTKELKNADTAPNILAQGLKAIGLGGAGTDEPQMNKLFDLDKRSLKKVDAELRKSYPGGLREFIASNYGENNDTSDKTRDLFMKRLNAAGL